MLELDHVLISVVDLEAAARELEDRHGLRSLPGGRHPGWGTENRIVPLGDTYLELVRVADETEAEGSLLGRWAIAARPASPRPLGWCVRTDGLDDRAARLGVAVIEGSRDAPGGEQLRWRTAGLEAAVAEPCLPFFIEWGNGTSFPGHAAVRHPAGDVTIERLFLDGDAAHLAGWLGEPEGGGLPQMTVRAGAPALAAVILAGAAGDIVIGATDRPDARS